MSESESHLLSALNSASSGSHNSSVGLNTSSFLLRSHLGPAQCVVDYLLVKGCLQSAVLFVIVSERLDAGCQKDSQLSFGR